MGPAFTKVTFVMAYVIDGSMFDRYSPVMPMTLSLLMVNDGAHHVEYEKSSGPKAPPVAVVAV